MALHFDMLGLVCADIEASLRFYGLLGVPVPEFDPERPYVETTLPNGLRLSWNSVELAKKVDADWVEPVGQRMGMAFLCDSPQAVDATYQAVIDAGFEGHQPPWDAFWGQRYAQVLDPDGNTVDLFAPLKPTD